MTDISGVAVVTGSTSGIGKAIASRLLSSGYAVTANYAGNDERAALALAEFKNVSSNVLLVKANVGQTEEAEREYLASEKIKDDDADLHNNRAVALMRLGREDDPRLARLTREYGVF